jgi:GntR family transcriptional regulator, arabinose operon transcriptional repressor
MKKENEKYVCIANEIRESIQMNAFSNSRLPPERELASQYNVNRQTLRKAITLLEKEKLVFKNGNRGTFVMGLESLAKAKGKTVGFALVKRNEMDHFHSQTLLHLERACRCSGYDFKFFSINNINEFQDIVLEPFKRKLLDGIILSGVPAPSYLEVVIENKMPAVLVGYLSYYDPIQDKVDRITTDCAGYAKQATDIQIKNGARKIAFIYRDSYQYYQEMLRGYMTALDQAQIPFKEELVSKCFAEDDHETLKAMERVLERTSPDAVFVANERLLGGVHKAFIKHDYPLSIPIITAGAECDKLAAFQRATLIRIPNEEIAKRAVHLLGRRFNYRQSAPETELIDVSFIKVSK